MKKENKFIEGIRNEARNEATKDFAADWGGFWKVAGSYIGQYAMAFVGFFADFAVAFSMLYGATRSSFGAFMGAAAVCTVIQYGYGGATFRIAKAVKTGKISEGRYMRSAIIAGGFGLAALGASLYLSYNFDAVFRVASEPVAEGEMKDENAILAYYETKLATLRADYETERNALQAKRNDLGKQRNEAGEVLWTARRTIEKIDTKTAPALRATFEQSIAALEAERAQRLQQVIAENETTGAKWEARIAEGAYFTRWFNIAVNLLRVLLIIGRAIFLLDVYQDDETEEKARQATPKAPPLIAISNPPKYATPAQFAPPSPVRATPPPDVAEEDASTKPEPVANWMQRIAGADVRNVAAQLGKAKARARAYRSKIERNEGDEATNRAGLAKAMDEIARLEKILSSVK